MKNFALCLVGFFVLTGFVFADGECCDKDSHDSPKSALTDEIKKLGARIFINVLLNELNLSDEQLNNLFELVKEVNDMKKKRCAKLIEIMQEQVKWYENFKKENMKLEGFSKKAERKAGEAEYKSIEFRKKMGDEIKKFESEAKRILNSEQIKLFDSIVEPRDSLSMILKPANLRDKKLKDITLKLPTKRSDKDKSKSELEEAYKELEEVYKEKRHLDYGTLGKFLVVDGLPTELALRLKVVDFKDEFTYPPELSKLEKQTRELFMQINLINLMNGMNFSTHQLSHIIHCAKDVKEFRNVKPEEPTSNFSESDLKELKNCVVKILDLVRTGTNKLSDSLSDDIQSISRKFAEVRKTKMKGRPDSANKEVQKAIDEIYDILFESQKGVLYSYNPCLIPPKNLKDPVRVGQASNNEVAVNMLKMLRKIPEEKYNKNEIIERTISRSEEHGGKFDSDEREEIKKKLSDVLDKVRTMSDTDFELEKENIAKELEFLNKIETLRTKIGELLGEEVVVKTKIRDNLLNPEIIEVAQERLNQLKEFNIGKPVDLDSISPAEMCRDGKCAVKD